MDIQVWIVENLFGGNTALFTSAWDLIQGIGLVVIAAFYKFYQVKASKVESLFTKHSTEYQAIAKEFTAIQSSVAALADILITMTLASASLDATAKQKIVGYAEQLKNTSGISIDDATSKLINAVVNLKEGKKQLAEEAEAIVKQAVVNTTETIKVTSEADTVTNNLPI